MPRVACVHYWREEFPWELHKNLGVAYAQGLRRKLRSRLEFYQGVFQLVEVEGIRLYSLLKQGVFVKDLLL